MSGLVVQWCMGDVCRSAVTALHDGARSVRALPQLQVLWAVVCRVSVDVMDGFTRLQHAAKHFAHDVAVLKYPSLVGALCSCKRMLRHVDMHVAMHGFSSAFEMPVVARARLEAMAANERVWVPAELAALWVADLHDVRWAATSAFTRPIRDFFWRRLVVALRIFASSVDVCWKKACRVPAVFRWRDGLPTSAFTNECSNGSDHVASVCRFYRIRQAL